MSQWAREHPDEMCAITALPLSQQNAALAGAIPFPYEDECLPPGAGGSTETRIIFDCTNPNCEQQSWTARARAELGTRTLFDEDEALCPECGREGEAR